jgi:glutathione S-transferase
MHSGFAALRSALPMNVEACLPTLRWNIAVQKDIDRIVGMWHTLLTASKGPFLFGAFGAADAFFAPVVFRFRTYEVLLPPDAAAYRDRVLACEGMQAWADAARKERHFLDSDEPYRARP